MGANKLDRAGAVLGDDGPLARQRRGRDPEQLDAPGFGQYPQGSDPEEPFITVIWWTNVELIHHMAEIALLRDLWRVRSAATR